MGPHASPLRAHPPSIPRPGTLSQPQPSRRAAAAQARTAAGPKAQGVGGGRGGAAAAEAAAAPEALAKRLRRPRAESALPVRLAINPEGLPDLVLHHPQQLWKTASPGGAQRCARRRPAADRLKLFVQLVLVHRHRGRLCASRPRAPGRRRLSLSLSPRGRLSPASPILSVSVAIPRFCCCCFSAHTHTHTHTHTL